MQLTQVSKAYKQYPSRLAQLLEWIDPRNKERHVKRWVLQDIDVTMRTSESIGIIGMNGAGKSTLLKIVTGTTQATQGTVEVRGHVAALLELGLGFHPDFTGRQNVFMAGQLMGLSHDELMNLMPEIEAFAEIGEYIDLPLRVYSSGMQMRLAFSVATAKRPDILIIDEALSVGDAHFIHKSFARIKEFKEAGTSLLLVSHDQNAIQTLCDRAILLNASRIAAEGDPETVFDYYNALIADQDALTVRQSINQKGRVQTISGTGEASIESVRLCDQSGRSIEVVHVGESVTLCVDVLVKQAVACLVLGYSIKDRLGQIMYGTNTALTKQALDTVQAGDRFRFSIEFDATLGPGSYSVQLALVGSETHLEQNFEWRDLALVFHVIQNTGDAAFLGCTWMNPHIEIHSR